MADDAYFQGGAINSGAWGGFGTLSVADSTFTDDDALSGRGHGGAIDVGDGTDAFGSLYVTDSTFLGNGAGSSSVNADGGAIDVGDDGGTGNATVSQSTFSGNSALDNGRGGAIDVGDDFDSGESVGSLVLTASTLAANSGYDTINSGGFGGTGYVTV